MRQLLQNMRTGKTTVEEVPKPIPEAKTALVRTAASLVSAGTERMLVEFAEKSLVGKARSRPDLVRQVIDKARSDGLVNTFRSAIDRLDQPMALGYSSAGIIESLGKDMPGFKVGQRVACAGGGHAVHAEYAVVPRNLLVALPDDVELESAAFTTLGAIALHSLRLAEVQLGEHVAVVGLGLLGLLTTQIALASGCHVLGIDIDPERVARAKAYGAEACLRDQAETTAQHNTLHRGADAVIICATTTSNDPVELAGLIARDRARIVAVGAVGLGVPRRIYYEKELSLINSRSYGPGRYDPFYEEYGQDYPIGYVRWTEGRNLEAVVKLIEHGKLDVKSLISHRFPLEQAVEAYELITGKKKEPFLGVLLTYPEVPVREAARITFGDAKVQRVDKPDGISLGVIGAGVYAQATLLPVVKKIKGVDLVGIASSGGLHAQHAAKKFGFSYACSDADEIIQDPNINTVAILTRHDTHAELIVKSLQAGKHVFAEKPLAINQEQLIRVSGEASRNPTALFTIGYNRRFAPLARRLVSLLSTCQEPVFVHYRVNAGYIPLSHWLHDPEIGGGRIIGEGCHFIDFIQYLVGRKPVSISAQALPDGGKYNQDNVTMTLTFKDGSIGVVDYLASGDKSFPKERVEIFCGGRIAVLDDFRSLVIVQDGKRKVIKGAQDKGWRGEWLAFTAAIREGGEPPIPLNQLIAGTQAVFAVSESLREGGQQISLS